MSSAVAVPPFGPGAAGALPSAGASAPSAGASAPSAGVSPGFASWFPEPLTALSIDLVGLLVDLLLPLLLELVLEAAELRLGGCRDRKQGHGQQKGSEEALESAHLSLLSRNGSEGSIDPGPDLRGEVYHGQRGTPSGVTQKLRPGRMSPASPAQATFIRRNEVLRSGGTAPHRCLARARRRR